MLKFFSYSATFSAAETSELGEKVSLKKLLQITQELYVISNKYRKGNLQSKSWKS